MYVVSTLPIMNRDLLAALLAALNARPAGALLATPTVHLFTAAAIAPWSGSAAADFTEATFSGYAPVALGVVTGPVNLPSGDGIGLTVEADFVAGGGLVPPGETILGYWIDDAGAPTPVMYAAEALPEPIPIGSPGDFVSLDFVWGQVFAVPVQ